MNWNSVLPHTLSIMSSFSPFLFSVEALRAAVASHEGIEAIQELFEGGVVPKDVRAEFWKVHLSLLLLTYTSPPSPFPPLVH